MRWWLAVLLAPFVLLAGLIGTPSTPPKIEVAAPSVIAPVAAPVPTVQVNGDLVGLAMQWVNARVPYLWGGCSMRGVDCSCFVINVWRVFGVNLPRTTVLQKAALPPVGRDDLRVGDVVFFDNTCSDCGANPTHEGLYIGNGLMAQAGDPVQVSPVFTGFYGSRYAGAGRVR